VSVGGDWADPVPFGVRGFVHGFGVASGALALGDVFFISGRGGIFSNGVMRNPVWAAAIEQSADPERAARAA
jgi:hypothetical protein